MRPHKHVAPQSDDTGPARYQNIIGVDLARFQAPWGQVPLVATTEIDRLTLFYWDDLASRWAAAEQPHRPLSFDGDTPAAPAGWNWSDHVALACSPTAVYVVYKRALADDQSGLSPLLLDQYRPSPSAGHHGLTYAGTQTLLAPAALAGREIGRSLWAGFLAASGELLVLCQVWSPATRFTPGGWALTLLRVHPNADGSLAAASSVVGEGGFDLDARLNGSQLLAVYRHTAEAFRAPVLQMLGSGLLLTSSPSSDSFYEPLQLTTLDLTTLQSTTEPLPGGEHPQIQLTGPLLITFDRPAALNLALDTPLLPLPPRRPRVIWNDQRTDKLAWLRQGGEAFRGTLLTSDDRTIPRSHAAMSAASHLFAIIDGLLLHAAPFANFPVRVLGLAAHRKGLAIDVLHHRDGLGLFRTRLQVAVADGALAVAGRAFEVWDIGHGWIGDPQAMVPSADGETTQFAPTAEQAFDLTRSSSVLAPPAPADNTLGGHLAADSAGFFAYSDLGDGGLRVIFATDGLALADPPPIGDPKTLRPEQVTGPHLPCDEWIELHAADLTGSQLIGYAVGLLQQSRSLGSTLEVAIDVLLDACTLVTQDCSGHPTPPLDPLNGLSQGQLQSIDCFRTRPLPPLSISLAATDGTDVTISVSPGAFVAGVAVTLSLAAGSPPAQAAWTVTPLDSIGPAPLPTPAGPLPPGAPGQVVAFGNPATVTVPTAGNWRLSLFEATPAGGSLRAAADVVVGPSTYDLLTGLYSGVARTQFYQIGDLDVSLLQYRLHYSAPDFADPSSIAIAVQPQRATELRFSGGGARQGLAESFFVLGFSSQQMKFRQGLDLLFSVSSFQLNLRYGRPFTPGLLMRDSRARDTLTFQPEADRPFETVRRDDPLHHAGLGAKPFGSASIPAYDFTLAISVTPWGIGVPALLAGLAVMGAFALAQTIAGLFGLVALATTLGLAGLALGAAAGIALAVTIAVAVPPLVERFAAAQVQQQFSSGVILAQTNQQPLVRYAGEGAAEAIARQALAAARAQGLAVPAPAAPNDPAVGHDRLRGQLFQMIFVTHGLCRVLLRLDDCAPAPGEPKPAQPGDPDNPPTLTGGG